MSQGKNAFVDRLHTELDTLEARRINKVLALILSATFTQRNQADVWLDLLRQYAEVERVCLCIDVDLRTEPKPHILAGSSGDAGLDRLGVAIDRSWSLIDGAYVFRRKAEGGDLRAKEPLDHVHSFLKSLGVLDLDSLRKGDLSFASLTTLQRRQLSFAIAHEGNGIGDSMLAAHPNHIGMRLVLEPRLTAKSRTRETDAVLSLDNDRSIVPYPTAETVDPIIEPLGGPDDGTLDFGGGEILTLAMLSERARLVFGEGLDYDARLSDSTYFMSGKYTQKRLLTAVINVTEPQPILFQQTPDAAQQEFDASNLKSLVFGPYRLDKIGLGALTIGDALDGKDTTFLAAFGKNPPQRIQAFMYEYRLEPTDALHVSAGVSLYFASPGMATVFLKNSDPAGSSIPFNTPHLVRFVL